MSAVLALWLMLVVQFLPGMAGAEGQGHWIEICADGGVALIQVDENGDAVPQGDDTCPDCATCAFCAVQDQSGLPAHLPVAGVDLTPVVPVPGAVVRLSVEQVRFWPGPRGPPARAEHEGIRASLPIKGSTQNTGGAPWI